MTDLFEILKFFLPLAGGAGAWLYNQRQQRAWERYQRKEERYRKLLLTARGFYVGAANSDKLKDAFISQIHLCWLYCPDKVIRTAYAFLESIGDSKHSDASRVAALGELFSAVREDLLSRQIVKGTSLTAIDFKPLTPTKTK